MLISRDREGRDVLGGDKGSMAKEVATGCDAIPPTDAAEIVGIDGGVAVDIAAAAAVAVVAVVGLFLCNKFLIACMIGQIRARLGRRNPEK